MDVFEKIKAQQGKERTAQWMVGDQLADMIRREPDLADIVDKDLDVPEMSLTECEKKIKAFADKHKTGNFACVTPIEAEKSKREFYGLGEQDATSSTYQRFSATPEKSPKGPPSPRGEGLGVSLSDFFG